MVGAECMAKQSGRPGRAVEHHVRRCHQPRMHGVPLAHGHRGVALGRVNVEFIDGGNISAVRPLTQDAEGTNKAGLRFRPGEVGRLGRSKLDTKGTLLSECV